MEEQDSSKPQRKGIYLLPNLFTTATLFGGFYAIIAGLGGRSRKRPSQFSPR